MFLLVSYEKVAKANCRSYFSSVGTADYSVLSSVLDKQTTLFNNARDCLVSSIHTHTQYLSFHPRLL